MKRFLMLSAILCSAQVSAAKADQAAEFYRIPQPRDSILSDRLSTISLDLTITSAGKTIKSTAVVASGEPFSFSSLEKRGYSPSVTYEDGVKKSETKSAVDLGVTLDLIPREIEDGRIAVRIMFVNKTATPGAKAIPPNYFQPYDLQGLTQSVVLKSGEPMKITGLSVPGSDKELSVTITAKVLPW